MGKVKKEINLVGLETKKANAQSLTCFVAFVATAVLAVAMMIAACVLPVLFDVTAVICWISMGLEAASAGLGFVAYWIKRNAL
jgi:hypothetical protein